MVKLLRQSFTDCESIKSPPSDEGLEVLQLVGHDGRQEQQVAEHADLYIFIVSPEADQHSDGNGEQLCEK